MISDNKKVYKVDDLMDDVSQYCGIYLITNTCNDKKYVGQSVDIISRWIQHCESDAHTELYKEMRRWGVLNFEFRILEECDPRYLDEKEVFWINEYDTYNNGYNSTQGNITAVKISEAYGRGGDILLPEEVEMIKKNADPFYISKQFKDTDYIWGTDKPEEAAKLIEEIEHESMRI